MSRFIAAINRHDVPGLMALLSPEHRFTDSLGATVSGPAELERAWRGYFDLFPDYRIDVGSVLSDGSLVAVFGTASGTLRTPRSSTDAAWETPAAWRALVGEGRLIEWQVYADTERVYELLSSGGVAEPP